MTGKRALLRNVLEKPELIVHAADHTVTARALVSAFAKFSPNLYTHNGALVSIVLADDGKPPTVWPINKHGVIIEAHKIVQPIKQAAEKRTEVTLPTGIAELCLQVPPPEWPLRPLTAFTNSPIVREDGTIHCEPGYDKSTGVFVYNIPKITVPDAPSIDDAERALKTLRHAVRTFAFGDRITISETFLIDGKSVKVNVVNLAQPPGKDESAFLVALLTAVCRPSLWVAPAVIVKSPSISGSGVGKALLLRAMSIIAYDQQPHAAPIGRGDEFEKGLVAALIRASSSTMSTAESFNRKRFARY